ncbi:hypothetical protein CFC21_009416 [Triticum aestivum]|uniref:Receptor kinase-like protein Xa21 n=2 Tax=Triticum aestivum TaxID=4565 RepID=A0A3B5Z6I0_WHEAT|nr:hypothetical protein CFC21_009416 [Triticum aestivum]
MQYLSLAGNRLSGEIPPGLGNLYNLAHLGLSSNTLSGVIPSSLGLLSNLSWLSLGYNNLSGVIPDSIWNISSLTLFSVQQNTLSGTIPPNAFDNLPSLHSIYMDNNQFHGRIPASIANASDVSLFQLHYNFFDGVVPPEVGRLRNLSLLQISANLLRAQEPKDWQFITALANCSQLTSMEMGANNLEGVLPDSLSNFSTSLINLSFRENKISGSIPRDIGNLVNLGKLDISYNSFTGTFPSSFSELTNLVELYVIENRMSGSIPWTIGNLTELNYLDLRKNAFSGRLPSTIGNLSKLSALYLSSNSFTGPIPIVLFNISSLSVALDLSHNNLMGSIPQEIGYLKNLVEFHAESNKLTGEIPDTLGECQLLQNLYLQNNILTGGIPTSMSQLKGLGNLDLSRNNLTGQIPNFLVNITMLNYLNLSFNIFVGEVPYSGVFANATAIWIQGNHRLCGGIPDLHLPPCSSQVATKGSLLIPIVVLFAATIVILSLICVFISWRKITTKIPSTTSMQGHQFISYSQLARATNGFSTTNLLGFGAFGTVFKGTIGVEVGESTRLVAVKVLKLQAPGALKSFIAECEALRNLRHRNLVKIITACSSIDNRGNDFKAIVLDFMPNGSLDDWLHPGANDQAAKNLNLIERVNILLDVANALDYLHCHGHAPVLHCDLKTSNVLLDAEMVAHVGDFGLAKILVETSSYYQHSTSSMGFRGTFGYAPPEYGAGNMISTYADIYSYGILVLETVTGKKPTDSKFGEGLSLRQYAELGLRGRPMDVADNRLLLSLENELQTADDDQHKLKIDCVISLLGLGLSCSHEMPSSRMATGDIIKELHTIKKYSSLLRNPGSDSCGGISYFQQFALQD